MLNQLLSKEIEGGWEYYNANNPEKIAPLVEKSKSHFAELEAIEATPYDVAAKPEKPTFLGYLVQLLRGCGSQHGC